MYAAAATVVATFEKVVVKLNWFQRFAQRFPYKSDYTCIDIETSGLSPATQQICTIGHMTVRDNRPVQAQWYALKWTQHPNIDQPAFAASLEMAQKGMEKQGKNFYHTWDWLDQHGEEPLTVLEKYLQLVEGAESNQELLIAHNGWRFDAEFLRQSWNKWLGVAWSFTDDAIYDSGVAEKACQLGPEDEPDPRPDESLQQWARRVGNKPRRGIYWALDRHCCPKYGLVDAAGFTDEDLHVSVKDAALLHYLYQAHKQQAEVA